MDNQILTINLIILLLMIVIALFIIAFTNNEE